MFCKHFFSLRKADTVESTCGVRWDWDNGWARGTTKWAQRGWMQRGCRLGRAGLVLESLAYDRGARVASAVLPGLGGTAEVSSLGGSKRDLG